jgi:beta-lactamase regulating signal transducer with metallopeptidase domain
MHSFAHLVSGSLQSSQCAALVFDAWLKSLLVLALAGGLCVAWRRASAATRHLIWLFAVVSLPCLPLLSSRLSSWQKPLWSVAARFDSANQIFLALEFAPGAKPGSSAPSTLDSPDVSGSSNLAASTASHRQLAVHFNTDWLTPALGAWAGGVALALGFAVPGRFQLRRMFRRSRRLHGEGWKSLLDEACETLRIGRPVILLESADKLMPLTWGGWRPVVLLPAEAGQWPAERRRVVLLHELAHVKRWDCLTQSVVRIICAIFWCNPLVWLAARRLRVEQERACDDLVLNGGCKASDYAGHLVAIARSFRRVPPMAGIAMARPSGLEQRVTAILDGQRNRRRMARMVVVLIALGLFGLEWLVGGYAKENLAGPESLKSPEVSAQLKAFVAEKEAQARAGTNEVSVFKSFFAAADRGDWLAVSNAFAELRSHAGQYEQTDKAKIDERLRGAAWQAVLEIWGAFDAFGEGDEKYSALFGNDIIASIPAGSIYFGGTDAGRFIVTALQKSHVKADPFFTLTQNAMADSSHLDYLRGMYGDRIYVPTSSDSQKCFEDYLQDVARRLDKNQLKPGENAQKGPDGKVQISGQVAVMEINGLMVKIIFDKNPGREFYIEESYPFDWMYPHLEPHGLIMKINRQPLAKLSDEILKRDHNYWARLVAPMMGDWLHDDTTVGEIAAFATRTFGQQNLTGFTGDPRFIQNAYSHRAFSKLRASQGGLYAWRARQTTDASEKQRMNDAADFAFRQAWALCPYSPEAVFRYVRLLMEQNRVADALVVADAASQLPANQGLEGEQMRNLVKQLKTVQKAKAKTAEAKPDGLKELVSGSSRNSNYTYSGATVISSDAPGAAVPKSSGFQVRLVVEAPADGAEAMTYVASKRADGQPQLETLYVQKTVLLDQSAVQSAKVVRDNSGAPQIEIQLTKNGAQRFAGITRQNLNHRLAMVIGGRIYMAPIVRSEISGGTALISGVFTEPEANALAATINGSIK